MDFLTKINWTEVIPAMLSIIGGCAVIAKITPWTWDDIAIGWVTKVIRLLGFQKKDNE